MKKLLILSMVFAMAASAGAGTIYVDADATDGANDGTSWADAYLYLQDGLVAAQTGDQIWVVEGVYTPDSNSVNPEGTGDREATFRLKNSVGLYGGYAGYGQLDPDERDVETYDTILSGDLEGNDGPDFANYDENSYSVVIGSGTDPNTVLDGFTITAGNADGGGYYELNNGGGMYVWNGIPTVNHCTFNSNHASMIGGGMYIYNDNFRPLTLTNCTFSNNSANTFGGGLSLMNTDGTLANCIFNENYCEYAGGGMSLMGCNLTVRNCLFVDNTQYSVIMTPPDYFGGGGLYNGESSPHLTNCTFSGNNSIQSFCDGGGAILNYDNSHPILTNCILWGDRANSLPNEISDNTGCSTTVSYSDVEGGWTGTGNIDEDPCFVLGLVGDYYLSQIDAGQNSNSPCMDTGSDTAANLGMDEYTTRTDIVTDSGIVDMGYHYPPIRNPECMARTNPDFELWLTAGAPDCWCYCEQCNGDSNGGTQFSGSVTVYTDDLDIFLPAFGNPDVATTPGHPGWCADLDHKAQFGGLVRVYTNDLDRLLPQFGSTQTPRCSGPGCSGPHPDIFPGTGCDTNPLPNSEFNFWVIAPFEGATWCWDLK